MAILRCAFGVSGSRKTTSMGRAARYMYEKTGLPGRAIYSDLGNWQVIRPEVEAGLIEPFNITGEPEFLMLLHKLARGWWPVELKDGVAIQRHDPVKDLKGNVLDPLGLGVPKMKQGTAGVGFYIWEGMTSSAELLMKYLRDYRIDIKAKDPLSPFAAKDRDTGLDMKFCANTMGHYGYVQDEIVSSLLSEFAALPVSDVFITAHESQGSDEDNLPIRGPGVVGKAAATRIGKNLGDMIHYEVLNTAGKAGVTETDVRCYYRSHPDPRIPNITYYCKTRLPESVVGELEATFPGGYFKPAELDKFLRACDGLLEKSSTSAAAWKAEIDAKRAGKEKANG